MIPGAHHRDVCRETEPLARASLGNVELAKGDSTGGVDVDLHRTGPKAPLQANVVTAARVEVVVAVLKEAVDVRLEPLGGEAVHAAVQGNEVDRLLVAVHKLLAEDGRKGDASLGVHRHRIRAREHVTLPSGDESLAPDWSVNTLYDIAHLKTPRNTKRHLTVE